MKYEDWRDTLEQGYSLGCRAVQFIGGEPTIYPQLPQLVVDAKNIGYTFIEVFTNGTALNGFLVDVFAQNDVHVAFSVYATSPATHDHITRRDGSFEKTLRGIRLALEKGLHTRAGVIAMDANIKEVEETKTFLAELGIESVGSDRVRGIGRGNNLLPGVLPMDELCGSCWKAKLAVDADGNAFPCVFSKFLPLGNIREGLAPIVECASLRDFRNTLKNRMITAAPCYPDGCDPATCYPASRPCSPECAPSSERCVPDLRRIRISDPSESISERASHSQ
jgi:MoaA/NifB/PqqE/SkfB family radical SAM enzyme